MDTVAKYYSIPSVSFRNSFFHAITANMSGYKPEEVYLDSVHPTARGSGYLADTVLEYLQQVMFVLFKGVAILAVDPSLKIQSFV